MERPWCTGLPGAQRSEAGWKGMAQFLLSPRCLRRQTAAGVPPSSDPATLPAKAQGLAQAPLQPCVFGGVSMWVGSENLEKGVFVFLWNKRMVQGTPLGAITRFLEPLSPLKGHLLEPLQRFWSHCHLKDGDHPGSACQWLQTPCNGSKGTPLGAIATFLEPLSPKGRRSARICVSMAPKTL